MLICRFVETLYFISPIVMLVLQCVVELQGKDHAKKLREALVENGYDPVWDDESAKNMI